MLECANNPCLVLLDVPHKSIIAHEHAKVDALKRILEATSEDETSTRALKWLLAMDAILLHTPTRGGRRGNANGVISHRLRLWQPEDFTPPHPRMAARRSASIEQTAAAR